MPSVVKRLVGWVFAGTLWTTGCAGLSSPFDAGEYVEGDYQTSLKPLQSEAEAVYLMLAAEVAGQRGHFDEALDDYLKLSKTTGDQRIAERATQIALFVKDTDKALEAVNLWLKRSPSSAAAHRVLLMLQLKGGHLDQANVALAELLKLKDAELENTLIEIVKWLDSELPKEQGLKAIKHLSEMNPKVPELHFAYALLASNEGELEIALAETNRAMALRRNWGRAEMLQAQIMAQTGDVKAARASIEKALKNEPRDQRLRLIYAQLLAKSGDFRAAEKELEGVVLKDTENKDARFALASVWLELGDFERARSGFQSLVNDPRYEAQAQYSLGLIDGRKGRYESALERFDAVPRGPLEFDANLNAISSLVSLGRLDEVHERMDTMRKNFPSEVLRLFLLEAETFSRKGDHKSAFEVLNRAAQALPDQLDVLYSRALVAEQIGRLDILESDLRAILEKKPDDPAALNALGFSLADHDTSRLEDAEQYIKKALAQKPNDPAILDSYGWVLFQKNKREQSLMFLRKAYSALRDPEIAAHLGEVLWLSGQKTEARKVWREGWKQNPTQDDMKRVHDKYPEAF